MMRWVCISNPVGSGELHGEQQTLSFYDVGVETVGEI